MRGSLGLVIGGVVGAGAMYLALRPPWAHPAIAPSTGPAVVMVGGDAGIDARAHRHHGHHGATGGAGALPGPGQPDDDSEDTALPTLTAADKLLEWRGDDVALPTQHLDMSASGGEARALDDGEINAGISRGAGGLRDCVVQGATGTDLHATITFKLLVDGAGRVTRSRVQAPHYLLDKGLLGCAQRALGKLTFAATGAPTLVTLPVNLG